MSYSRYWTLIEVVTLIGAEILHDQLVAGDDRDSDEIGEELLIEAQIPDMRRALQRLREAALDRAVYAPIPIKPAGEPATIIELRPRRK